MRKSASHLEQQELFQLLDKKYGRGHGRKPVISKLLFWELTIKATFKFKRIFDFNDFYQQFHDLEKQFSSARDLFIAEIRSIAFARRVDDAKLRYWTFQDVGGNPDFVHTYFSHFLQGKMIYIISDPRDAYLSQMNEWKKRGKKLTLRMRLLYLYVLKCHYESIFEAHNTFGPDKILIVYYEELVSSSLREMERLSQFLGIKLTKNAVEQVSKSVHWKNNISNLDIFLVECMCLNLFQQKDWLYKNALNKGLRPFFRMIRQIIIWGLMGFKDKNLM